MGSEGYSSSLRTASETGNVIKIRRTEKVILIQYKKKTIQHWTLAKKNCRKQQYLNNTIGKIEITYDKQNNHSGTVEAQRWRW